MDILAELRPFFYPRSVAVVGVSQDPTKPGSCLLRSIQNAGFKGRIYPIGQRMTEINGLPVFPAVSAVPDEIDLVRIAVPAGIVPGVIQECKAKKVPAVEIITSGFREMGTDDGRKLEAAVAALAGDGLRIIGPNCFGVYSPQSGVTHIPGDSYPRNAGPVGFISQSGGISEDVSRAAMDYGFRMSKVISYGNACDINETDLLSYMAADPATKIIGIYIEGARRGREFFKVLAGLAKQKPVIIWKGGLSPEGARAASSHTASLSGSEKVWQALFHQTSAIQVNGLEELLDTINAFCILPPVTDHRLSVICSGGGNSVAATDIAAGEGLSIPKFKDELKQKIAALLPPVGASAANPVDVGPPFFPPAEAFKTMLDSVAASENYGTIVIDKLVVSKKMREILDYKPQMNWEDKEWLETIPVEAARAFNTAVIVVLRSGGDKPGRFEAEAERRRLAIYYSQNGVPVYPTMARALKSLGKVVNYYRNRLPK